MLFRTAGRAVIVSALAAGALATAGPAEAGSSFYGCPAGAVCIYNGSTPDTGIEPGGVYWSYGAHNLYNQNGYHAVINNQTGGAWLTFCGGSNGRGQWLESEAPNTAYPPYAAYLTPVNSIILTSGYHASCP